MKKIIVEVGSTNTKIDEYDGVNLKRLDEVTIPFKKNYVENKALSSNDINELIKVIKKLNVNSNDIYVCGTSIFRDLSELEKNKFLEYFYIQTGCEFHIISQEKENELTVLGATRFVNDKVCIFIGGGGSTEISIYDNGIKSSIYTKIGVMDVMRQFPTLASNYADVSLEDVKKYIKERLNVPKDCIETLILTGGGHKYFAENLGINYTENTLYSDINAPIMMDIKSRVIDTNRYYKEISLDEIKKRVDNPNWWFATRAMCAFVLVVADAIGAKYIIPTDIGMAYGILNDIK